MVLCRLDGSEKEEAVRAMEALGKIYPELSGYYPEPKGLLQSGNPVDSESDGSLFTIYRRSQL